MASRDLTLAHPELARSFTILNARFQKWFPGWKLLVVTTYRSPEEQLVEFKAGRSQLDGFTRVGKHNRQPSDAIDVMIVAPGGLLLDTLLANRKASREQFDAMYGLMGMWAQELGYRWGGDWNSNKIPVQPDPEETLWDPYHIERRTN